MHFYFYCTSHEISLIFKVSKYTIFIASDAEDLETFHAFNASDQDRVLKIVKGVKLNFPCPSHEGIVYRN